VPFLGVKSHSIGDSCVRFWKILLELCNVVPSLLGDPIEGWFGWLGGSIKHLSSPKEEVPLLLVDNSLSHLKFDAHLHGEQQLMSFKE